jgi:uncharacterized SAM-binding protein YcdF (DUF218 family)
MNTAERVLTGAVAGAATWVLLALLGVPHVFGIGLDAGLVPLTILAAIFAVTRVRLLFPVIAMLLVLVTIGVAYTPVVVKPAQRLVRSDSLPSSADAVVALSGGMNADGYLTQQGADRTLKAVELVANGVAPVLLFTREEKMIGTVMTTSAEDQRRIASLGRVTRLLSTRRVRSTRDEALAVARVAQYRGWKRIVLVTSPFHSRRACATFEKAGLTVSCIPSDSRDVSIRRMQNARDRIVAFGLVLYETAGTLRYRLSGWV